MNENESIDADAAQREADGQAVSDDVERRCWGVLNDPTKHYAQAPRAVAKGIAKVFVKVLNALADTDADDLGFDLALIDQVERAVLAHAGQDDAPVVPVH